MIHDQHLAFRISQLERGACVTVFSEAQRIEAKRIIGSTRPFDNISVKMELPEDYDGRMFIIDLSDF